MSLAEAPKLNLLVAYPYLKKPIVDLVFENKSKINFVLDSGAFTAWKAGKEVQLDDYCRFIESLPFEPWRYFTLDVIGDPHASLKNYEIMIKRGFKPVPIFTRGENPSVLDDYYKTSDVVGVGGLVGTRGNKAFVNGIMKHINGRKVHWLGFTLIDFIKHYRPYMCDSSNYSRGDRFGIIDTYLGNGQMAAITRKNAKKIINKDAVLRWEPRGFNLMELASVDNWKNTRLIRELPTWSWVDFSLDCKKNIGTNLFVAMTGVAPIQLAINAFNTIRGNK